MELFFSLAGVVISVPLRWAYVTPPRQTTIHLCVHTMGSSEKVDDHTGKPAAMHMLQNNHKFTITLPSCLRRRLQGVPVFLLSSLLQKDKS